MPKVSDAHFDARRAQILEAAGLLFAKHGFRETQMRQVAEAADLSTGALYRYFSSKEDLFEAMIDEQRPGEQRLRDTALSGEGSAMDRLEALPLRFLDLPSSQRGFERHFRDYGEAAEVPFLKRSLAGAVSEASSEIEVLVREAKEDGDLRGDVDPAATAVMIAVQIVALRFAVLFGPEIELDVLVRSMTAMVSGLRSSPP